MSPAPTRTASMEKTLVQAKMLEKTMTKDLEEYVTQQINDETYDMEANLALLKIYQFFPDEANADIILKLLLKALSEMPSNAFVLSTYLIPERFHQKKEVETVKDLHQMLEECRFQEFWNSAYLKDIPNIPGFESAVRDYAYNVLAISHQSSMGWATGEGCFSGLGLGALGKLHHSHYYYSQVVCRYGGRWVAEEQLHKADYVVVPINVFGLCKTNPKLRLAVMNVAKCKQCTFIDESFMVDSLAAKRRLLPSEVSRCVLRVPVPILKEWRLDTTRTMREQLREKLEVADQLTESMLQEGLATLRGDHAAPTPPDVETEPFKDPPKLITKPAYRDEIPEETITYYSEQQAGYNAELNATIKRTTAGSVQQLKWLSSQTETAQTLIQNSLTDTKQAVLNFNANIESAERHEGITPQYLAKQWSLKVPSRCITLYSHPLAPFKRMLTDLKSHSLKKEATEEILASLIPVWDSYYSLSLRGLDCTSVSVPSVPKDIIDAHVLMFRDALECLKESVLIPHQEFVREKTYEIQKSKKLKAASVSAHDYQGVTMEGLREVALQEEVLSAMVTALRDLHSGSVDVGIFNGTKRSFVASRERLEACVASATKLKDDIVHDTQAVGLMEEELRKQLIEADRHRVSECEHFAAKLDANALKQQELLKDMQTLNEQLMTLMMERKELCKENVSSVEKATNERAVINKNLSMIQPMQNWLSDLGAHTEKCFEMLEFIDGYYEHVQSMLHKRKDASEELECTIFEHAKSYHARLLDYCGEASSLINSMETKRAGMLVHSRAIDLQVKLAASSLDDKVEDMKHLKKTITEELNASTCSLTSLKARVANEIRTFENHIASVLMQHAHPFQPPLAAMQSLSEAGEAVTLDALTLHLQHEKVAVANTVRRQVEDLTSPTSSSGK